jgi:N-acetylglucosaminyldiphosphoundecaprenol N-acetyl-beta-D-mannosaminyltransferase
MRIQIMGVPIDGLTRREAGQRVRTMLGEGRGHLVTTPNPEMLVLADRDARFRDALRGADLAIPDGVGLLYVARLKGTRLPERISGADFTDDIAAIAEEQGAAVYLLGGREGVAKRAAAALRKAHPALKVVGAESGGTVHADDAGDPCIDSAIMDAIKAAAPQVLFVAFGHGAQEKWITSAMKALPSIRLAMGVGGTFDFLSGDVPRAPSVLRKAGLEWLWRLLRQPWRLRRIWTAVAVFPYLALRRKD